MTSYLNGVETIRELTGPTPIAGVDTAVIALIGTAPIFEVAEENRSINAPKLITSERNGVTNFGHNHSGYTIPEALKNIYAQSGAKVIAINVFDPDTHKSSVTAQSATFSGDTLSVTAIGLSDLAVKSAAGTTTFTAGADYIADLVQGIIKTVSGGRIAANQAVKLDYSYADPSKVTLSDIIGEIDVDGNRSGIKLLEIAKAATGYKPKIIIAPGFTSSKSVVDAIKPIAAKLKAVYYVDAPSGATIPEIIEDRGTNGTGSFNNQDKRAQNFYPSFNVPANYDGVELEVPASAHAAGVRAKVDREHGPHWSIGNQPVNRVSSVAKFVSWELNDPDTDSNIVNAQGITVTVNTGELRFWGNRNASYPQNADIDSFECVVRTADYIEESIEFATLQKMAGPIDQSMIDDVLLMVTSFLNNLKGPNKRWIIDGICWYDKELNPATELAKGNLVIPYEFLPPPPLERMTYRSQINIALFSTLGGE